MLLSVLLTRFVGFSESYVHLSFRSVLILVLPCLILLSGVANAERQLDLYTDTQLVLDQSDKLRQQAMRASLAEVFIRVTGNAQVVKQSAIAQALLTPATYISQYRYSSTNEVITIAGARRPAQTLWLQFSEQAIQRVLQLAQLPVWSGVRPEILLWVVVDDSGKRILNSDSTAINIFKRIASTRGLPLAIPLLDLADRQALTASRLWARDETAIARASSRYGPDGVLAGRLVSVSSNLLRGDFVLTSDGRSYYFTAEGVNNTQVIQDVMDQAVNALASANAAVALGDSAAPHIVVAIDGVIDFADYAKLLESLRNISSVNHVMLQEVDGNHLIVSLRYQGSEATLLRQVASLPNVDRLSVNQFMERYQSEQDRVSANVAELSSDASNDSLKPNPPAVTSAGASNGNVIAPIIDVAFTWAGSASR